MDKQFAEKAVSIALSTTLALGGATAFVGTACLSPDGTPGAPDVALAKAKNKKARKAFKKVLNNLLDESESYSVNYKYVDLNKDGIDELYVTYQSSYNQRGVARLYAYKSSKAKKVYSNDDALGATWWKKTRCIEVSYGHGGIYGSDYIKWNGKKLTLLRDYQTRGEYNRVTRDYSWTYYYKINGKSVSKSKYNKRLKKTTKGSSTALSTNTWYE